MWRFFKNIIQLIISPDNGWDDISCTSIPARAVLGTVWSIGIATLSPWVKMLYSPDVTWLRLIQESIITGVSYGLAYFLAGILMNSWMPKINGGEDAKDKITIFNSYIISILLVQVLITNVLPLSFAILSLWPIYVAVIIWRGMKYMGVEERDAGKFIAASIIALIAPALVLFRLFYFIL